jgi:hypothetical protein
MAIHRSTAKYRIGGKLYPHMALLGICKFKIELVETVYVINRRELGKIEDSYIIKYDTVINGLNSRREYGLSAAADIINTQNDKTEVARCEKMILLYANKIQEHNINHMRKMLCKWALEHIKKQLINAKEYKQNHKMAQLSKITRLFKITHLNRYLNIMGFIDIVKTDANIINYNVCVSKVKLDAVLLVVYNELKDINKLIEFKKMFNQDTRLSKLPKLNEWKVSYISRKTIAIINSVLNKELGFTITRNSDRLTYSITNIELFTYFEESPVYKPAIVRKEQPVKTPNTEDEEPDRYAALYRDMMLMGY